jgi:hypothetical protein
VPPVDAVEDDEEELLEPAPLPEPVVDVLEGFVVLDEDPDAEAPLLFEEEDPDELDEPEPAGRGGPRLKRISVSIRAKSARANWLCSTTSRPICVWRSCTLIAM